MIFDDIAWLVEGLAWLWGLLARSRKTSVAGGNGDDAEVSTPGPQSDRSLLKALREWDPRIKQLRSAGDLYGLLTVLRTENDPALRMDAADALTQIGHEEGLDYLIGLLRSRDSEERSAARDVLEDLDDPRANAALRSHRPVETAAEIDQLESAGDLYGLLAVLRTENDPALCLDAADALTQMGNEEGLDYLIGLLSSRDEDERSEAREILEDLNDPRADAALRRRRPVGAAGEPVRAAESTQAEHSHGLDRQSPGRPAGVSDPWAAYHEKQAALDTSWSGSISQPVAGAEKEMGAVAGEQTKWPRWVNDFGPGALGAFLVTLVVLGSVYFGDIGFTGEEKWLVLSAELIGLPVSAALGGFLGAAGGLLAKLIAQALHAGDQLQKMATTMGSFISGAATGFLCSGVFFVAPFF